MTDLTGHDLEGLRGRITPERRQLLDRVWASFRDQNAWVPERLLQQEFGKPALAAAYAEQGQAVLRPSEGEGGTACRLTFLGVLLTSQGQEAEGLLARYLAYVRDRYRREPGVEWVSSQEVEAALGLTAQESRLLRQLIRLSHWWGGGSGFAEREWAVGVPVDVDELPAESDLRDYVRAHALRHFLPPAQGERSAAREAEARGPFWFVRDGGLARRLQADWHEAQEVCGVRGWKSCVVLCGGILEAVLLEALSWQEPDPAFLPRMGAFRSAASLRRRPLAELAMVAMDRGLLRPDSLPMRETLRQSPALIHPARRAHRKLALTQEDAGAALEAVRRCLDQIGRRAASLGLPGR